jgi:hypothetical protein
MTVSWHSNTLIASSWEFDEAKLEGHNSNLIKCKE